MCVFSTFEDLLQNGLDIDSLCHSLNTFDFFEFLTSNDKMNIAELFKAHEKHLDSAEVRQQKQNGTLFSFFFAIHFRF